MNAAAALHICLLLCAAALSFSAPAVSQTYKDGVRAAGVGDFQHAHKIWSRLAEDGDTDAAYGLGMMHLTGMGSLTTDYGEAARWLGRAADAGHADARNTIAVMYYHGMGVGRDAQKALDLSRPAAEQGDPVAQYNLGYFYWQGHGVVKDVGAAAAWIQQAAKSGLPRAQYALGQMYRTGAIAPPNRELALSWYVAAAAQDHWQAKIMADEMIAAGVRLPVSRKADKAPAPATKTPVPAPSAAVNPTQAESGGYWVWLGSMESPEGAEELWRESMAMFPDLLSNASPQFVSVDLGAKGTFVRVLAGPGMSYAAASDVCQQLHARRPHVFCEARRG